MQVIAMFLALAVMSGLSLYPPPNHPPIAYDDEVYLLYHPVAVVEIPVLENDVDPEGQPLRVTRLGLVEGGKAEIIGGKVVRVVLDWPAAGSGYDHGLIAHGSYLVSDGVGTDIAEWYVWYWPEVMP